MIAEDRPYDKLYLEDVAAKHAYLFYLLYENKEYDIFSMIDVYMRESEIRRKMDEGNWMALNKSGKQIYNSVDFTQCQKAGKEVECDKILLEWMAREYVYLQWATGMSSKDISLKLPSEELARAYNPLHETSYKNACEKLYHKYLFGGGTETEQP